MSNWFVYLIRCRSGALYTGITTDVERRFTEHCQGRGAKSLRGREPLELVFAEQAGDRSRASRLEAVIKKLPKVAKEELVSGVTTTHTLLTDKNNGD